MEETIGSRRPFEQFVLLAVTDLAIEGEVPAHSFDVTDQCREHLADVRRDDFGGVERQEVIRALETLAEGGVLSAERTESPTGKGRPAYALAVEPATVLEALDDAETLGPYVDALWTAL